MNISSVRSIKYGALQKSNSLNQSGINCNKQSYVNLDKTSFSGDYDTVLTKNVVDSLVKFAKAHGAEISHEQLKANLVARIQKIDTKGFNITTTVKPMSKDEVCSPNHFKGGFFIIFDAVKKSKALGFLPKIQKGNEIAGFSIYKYPNEKFSVMDSQYYLNNMEQDFENAYRGSIDNGKNGLIVHQN